MYAGKIPRLFRRIFELYHTAPAVRLFRLGHRLRLRTAAALVSAVSQCPQNVRPPYGAAAFAAAQIRQGFEYAHAVAAVRGVRCQKLRRLRLYRKLKPCRGVIYDFLYLSKAQRQEKYFAAARTQRRRNFRRRRLLFTISFANFCNNAA